MIVRPLPVLQAVEVPGLAYYTAPPAPLDLGHKPNVTARSLASRAAEALDLMYGYYTPAA